jgi:methylmalonyl-CoA mutase
MSRQVTPFDAEVWELLATKELGAPPTVHKTPSGIEVAPIYSARDVPLEADSVPGAFPFLRGPYASMYTGKPWTIRQYAGFSTASESNAFYRNALASGQRGLSVAFDLATHRGYDSDHPRVQGDVGKAGVTVDSVEDMRELFSGIPLTDVSVSMTMNGAVLPIMAAYIVAAEEQSPETPASSIRTRLRGTLQNDILKEFLVRNTYIYPPAPSMRIAADIIAYAAQQLPNFNPISVSGYHFQEAGATSELELAFTLADGLEYVRAALARGLQVDSFAPRLSFFFGIGMNLFMEVAKLRAARTLWAELMHEHFAPQNPESLRLRMHCQTSGVSLTAQQPLNNIVRTTIEALAAVLGGTQSLHTNAYDEALALPSDDAARVARNTQLILQHETDVTRSVDPLGGSYFIEALTARLAARARELITEVETLGGMTEAIERGVPQARIARAAAERQLRLDRGIDQQIGVNAFADAEESAPPLRVIEHQRVLDAQLERLKQLKQERDAPRVEETLRALEVAAHGDDNLLPRAIDCMRARATVGEVSEVLAQVFGRHAPRGTHVAGVFAAGYANGSELSMLNEAIARFEARIGRRPRLLVAKLGQDGHDRGAKVIASGFADFGFDVDLGPLFQTPREVAQVAVDNDVHAIGISTQAGAHLSLVPELMRELQALGADDIVVVCGGIIPAQDVALLEQVGVALVFEPGAKVVDCAARVLELLNARCEP